jgi:hypothetical protein
MEEQVINQTQVKKAKLSLKPRKGTPYGGELLFSLRGNARNRRTQLREINRAYPDCEQERNPKSQHICVLTKREPI